MKSWLKSTGAKTFVLVLANAYNGMFLYWMIIGERHKDRLHKTMLLDLDTKVYDKELPTLQEAIRNQALVCAPKNELGTFDLEIMYKALAFNKSDENAEHMSRHDGVDRSAKAAWDVELGKYFQSADFGTIEFALTQHIDGPEDTKDELAGFFYVNNYGVSLGSSIICCGREICRKVSKRSSAHL